jgi:PAS domain-containing protein
LVSETRAKKTRAFFVSPAATAVPVLHLPRTFAPFDLTHAVYYLGPELMGEHADKPILLLVTMTKNELIACAFEAIPIPAYVVDDRLRIVFVNRAARESSAIAGLNADKLVGGDLM